jgi:hypothetical protein
MAKFDFLRFFLLFALFAMLAPEGAQAQKIRTPQDSLQAMVNSQPDSTRHGFFNAGKFNSTFHVQFDGDATYLYRQLAAVTGFQVAWVVNHKLSFGAKFDIITSPIKINKFINTLDTLDDRVTPNPIHPVSMAAMVTVGYILRSDKKISIEPNFGIGWSYLSFTDPKVGWIDQLENKREHFTSNYLIVNPSVSVIWNSTKYFRVGAVVGAQGVFGTDYLRVKTYRIRGLYGGLFLRFGTF